MRYSAYLRAASANTSYRRIRSSSYCKCIGFKSFLNEKPFSNNACSYPSPSRCRNTRQAYAIFATSRGPASSKFAIKFAIKLATTCGCTSTPGMFAAEYTANDSCEGSAGSSDTCSSSYGTYSAASSCFSLPHAQMTYATSIGLDIPTVSKKRAPSCDTWEGSE